MRRDSIFYKLFQQSPTLLFELVANPPSNADSYRFDEEATANLILRQLTKRFGELSEEIRSSITGLPLPVLEDLSEALLDFTSLADLQVWLEAR
ncbi:MAG: DUF4351 domain-containing protein [Nostoc sp. C3-bin3]|nr:DUF4351 domain-containing protein [Nostoc sp. C3-bin3]